MVEFPAAPLAEQQRIIAKIEELFSALDNGIESLKTAQEQLQVYRQALLSAFEGKITAQWRDSAWSAAPDKSGGKPRPPKTFAPLDKREFQELPTLPDSWIWEKLGWMTCGVEYGTAAKSLESGSVPVLRMGNIQNAKFDWSDLVYTSDEEEIRKYSLRDGDVLFNRTNSPELVGNGNLSRRTPGFVRRLSDTCKPDSNDRGQPIPKLIPQLHIARQYGNRVKTDGVNQSTQLTYLIFLKMAHEYTKPPYNRDVGIPAMYNWRTLKPKRGAELEVHYVTLLRELGNQKGMLGQIFTKAQNKIQDPAKLYRLIDMVDDTEWVTMGADVKGDIYDGLLEKTTSN